MLNNKTNKNQRSYQNYQNSHPQKKRGAFFVRIDTVDNSDEWIPQRANYTDAGFDLKARAFCVPGNDKEHEKYIIEPDETILVKAGFRIELRPGWEAQIRSRSGLALNNGVFVLNAPGTIDCGYRNEVGIILTNIGEDNFEVKRGDRLAQMVVTKIPHVKLNHVAKINEDTKRGQNGFGSTGYTQYSNSSFNEDDEE